jgi:hypothetical protein
VTPTVSQADPDGLCSNIIIHVHYRLLRSARETSREGRAEGVERVEGGGGKGVRVVYMYEVCAVS